jgi:glycosyltransferase involved in cell wall biosynthesis
VQIVVNEKNQGISRNTNKAIALANGEYTRLLDSDDIFPLDSTEILLDLAKSHDADMVYGNFVKTGEEPNELTNRKTGDFTYKYYPDALDGVLHNRFIRMGQLIKTSVLKAANGADERVFIQDESLPLRVAMKANGAIKMSANVVLVPKEIGNFSGNKVQLDNDRFMAYYFAIADNINNLPKEKLTLMYKRAVSAYWKMIKKTHKFPYIHWGFRKYLWVKLFNPQPHMSTLQKMYGKFMGLKNIRR